MSFVNIGTILFPVGSIYQSVNNTSPATFLGGTWSAITGRFLYANNGNSTGGKNSETINFNHTHAVRYAFTTGYMNGNGNWYTNGQTVPRGVITTHDSAWTDSEVSDITSWPPNQYSIGSMKKLGNKTISHVPAYQTVYCWKRTA